LLNLTCQAFLCSKPKQTLLKQANITAVPEWLLINEKDQLVGMILNLGFGFG
jgi:hypothetical protein